MRRKRLSSSMRFFLAVAGIYGVVYFFRPRLIQVAVQETGDMILKILPILAAVFVIIYLINRFLDPRRLQRHVGEGSGIKGWLYATVAGILISGPPYVLYPLLGDLKQKGMKNSLLAVLLYNRNVKIPFLPAMIYYFGLAFTVIISLYIVLFSFLNGLLVGILTRRKRIL